MVLAGNPLPQIAPEAIKEDLRGGDITGGEGSPKRSI